MIITMANERLNFTINVSEKTKGLFDNLYYSVKVNNQKINMNLLLETILINTEFVGGTIICHATF